MNRQTSLVVVVATAATMFSHLAAADVVTLAGDYQVIQRGADNTGACFVPLGGVDVPAGATIKYSVTLQGRAVASGDKKIDADLSKDEAGAEIAALKPGGPYLIEVSAVGGDGNVLAHTKYDNILVGDLWVVAGQSNAAGFAPVKERLARDPMANMLGMDGVWKPAIPPTHRPYETDARVIKDLLLSKCGFKSDEQIAEAGRKSQSGEHPVGGAGCDQPPRVGQRHEFIMGRGDHERRAGRFGERRARTGPVGRPSAWRASQPCRPPLIDRVERVHVKCISHAREPKSMPLYEYSCQKCSRDAAPAEGCGRPRCGMGGCAGLG